MRLHESEMTLVKLWIYCLVTRSVGKANPLVTRSGWHLAFAARATKEMPTNDGGSGIKSPSMQ